MQKLLRIKNDSYDRLYYYLKRGWCIVDITSPGSSGIDTYVYVLIEGPSDEELDFIHQNIDAWGHIKRGPVLIASGIHNQEEIPGDYNKLSLPNNTSTIYENPDIEKNTAMSSSISRLLSNTSILNTNYQIPNISINYTSSNDDIIMGSQITDNEDDYLSTEYDDYLFGDTYDGITEEIQGGSGAFDDPEAGQKYKSVENAIFDPREILLTSYVSPRAHLYNISLLLNQINLQLSYQTSYINAQTELTSYIATFIALQAASTNTQATLFSNYLPNIANNLTYLSNIGTSNIVSGENSNVSLTELTETVLAGNQLIAESIKTNLSDVSYNVSYAAYAISYGFLTNTKSLYGVSNNISTINDAVTDMNLGIKKVEDATIQSNSNIGTLKSTIENINTKIVHVDTDLHDVLKQLKVTKVYYSVSINYASGSNVNMGSFSGNGPGYEANSKVTIVATHVAGYKFKQWTFITSVTFDSGYSAASNPCVFTIKTNTSITVAFEIDDEYIGNTQITATITFDNTKGKINDSNTSPTIVKALLGAQMVLIAEANTGYRFIGWQINGETKSTLTTWYTQFNQNVNITGVFDEQVEQINLQIIGANTTNIIYLYINDTNTPIPLTATYDEQITSGTKIKLTLSDGKYVNWNINGDSTYPSHNTFEENLNTNTVISAKWAYKLTITYNKQCASMDNQRIDDDTAIYEIICNDGESVAFIITLNSGWIIDYYIGDINVFTDSNTTSNTRTVKLYNDATINVIFKKDNSITSISTDITNNDDYTQLNALYFDGKVVFDTGVTCKNGQTMYTNIYITQWSTSPNTNDIAKGGIYGSNYSGNTPHIWTAWATDNSANWRKNNIAPEKQITLSLNTNYSIIDVDNQVNINSNTYVRNNVGSFTSTNNIYIGGVSNTTDRNKFIGYIGVTKLDDNNTYYVWVPAKRKSDNVCGFYNTVTNIFNAIPGTQESTHTF